MKLPEEFVAEGLRLAAGATLFDIPITELSREELIAAAAQGWKAYTHKAQERLTYAEMDLADAAVGGSIR